jgi:hypothetical protein
MPILANGESGNISSSYYGTYSAWADGDFNLTKDTALRITFTPASVGDNFFVRLLPQGYVQYDAPQPYFLNYLKIYTVPASGVLTIPISDFLNGKLFVDQVTQAELADIGQIAVFSGSNAWNFPLNQTANKQVNFTQIAGIAPLRGISTSHPIGRPVPVPASADTDYSASDVPGTPPQTVTIPQPVTVTPPADASKSEYLLGRQLPMDNYLPVLGAAGLHRLAVRVDAQSLKNTNELIMPQLSVHDVTSPAIIPH